MHILHVIIGLNVGGAERALQRLVLQHKESAVFTHSVVSLTTEGVVGAEMRGDGVAVYALGLQGPLSLPVVFYKLCRLICRINPDIVQTRMYHADFIGGLAARVVGKNKVLWGVHSSDTSFPGTQTAKWFFYLCASLSNWIPYKILCVSDAGAKLHIRAGYPEKKTIVLHNGFDLQMPHKVKKDRAVFKKENGLPEKRDIVGFVSRFNKAKDIHNFVKAAGRVAQECEQVRFLLIGIGLDPTNKELVTWIEKTRFSDCFVLMGERRDMPDCLAAMDMLCLSSRTEAFPGVIGEAMAMGLPCVATDVGDAALLLGEGGLLVPPENDEALAKGILDVLRLSAGERELMGQKGRRRIEEHFSMEGMLAQYENLICDIMKEKQHDAKL